MKLTLLIPSAAAALLVAPAGVLGQKVPKLDLEPPTDEEDADVYMTDFDSPTLALGAHPLAFYGIDLDNLDNYCTMAQKVIARTKLTSTNAVFEDLGMEGIPSIPNGPPPSAATGFIASFATPYGLEGEPSDDFPLTTTQHVGYGFTTEGEEYAQTVMCKMKNADALNYHFPLERPKARQKDCSLINSTVLRQLRALLRGSKRGFVDKNVVFDDWSTFAGNQWTDSSPAPSAYMDSTDGTLHIVAKSLYVDRLDASPFVGPDKKGIQYCQTIAPAYLFKLLTGEVTPPTCDAPPLYEIPQGIPVVLPWDCANP